MIGYKGKGWKPFMIKTMALLMGICYLANPLHEQIRSVFHEMSHLLESPETILSHPFAAGGHEHDTHHLSEHEHYGHRPGEHRLAKAAQEHDHEHTLLNLIDSLFDTSDNQHAEDNTLIPIIKYDKHITSEYYSLPRILPVAGSGKPMSVVPKVRIGYSDLRDQPPQIFPPLL